MGATGLYISTGDMLKLGILYLNKGVWECNRVLSEKWVNIATTKNLENIGNPTGFSFWLNEEGGYRGGGAFGQSLVIYPEKNIVFAAHAFDSKNDIYAIIRDYLNFHDKT
jgi:CubicO group peptidase (beta-lactamase class C family)